VPKEITVQIVEETRVTALPAALVAETTTQTTVTSNQQLMALHKLVPWTEHDAVDPGRLQFWTKGTRLMRCIGIVDRSHDFRSFQFVSEEPTLFFYKPGQFVTLELTIDGKRYLRSYTISSSPSRPHLIEITVNRVKGGVVSNYLHDHLQIGDSVLMKPPGGKFHCFDTTTDKYLFLAAGSGVTPMLSMARWWHDIGAQPDVIFYHSVREPEDAVFTEDMMTFTSANRKFKYVAAFTSPNLPENWPGIKGRISEEQLLQIAPDFQERMVFTCGADSFMKKVKLILEKNGFALKERFRQESFGVPHVEPRMLSEFIGDMEEDITLINDTLKPGAATCRSGKNWQSSTGRCTPSRAMPRFLILNSLPAKRMNTKRKSGSFRRKKTSAGRIFYRWC